MPTLYRFHLSIVHQEVLLDHLQVILISETRVSILCTLQLQEKLVMTTGFMNVLESSELSPIISALL